MKCVNLIYELRATNFGTNAKKVSKLKYVKEMQQRILVLRKKESWAASDTLVALSVGPRWTEIA